MPTTFLRAAILSLSLSALGLSACQTGVAGNENGSIPLNDDEAIEYKKAINRCYKVGGTRVVKIMGELRCY
ncbi:MAG: hypothetical protein RL011_1745 [Pseudomonadota bacterium]|jgi:hypothetical protein